MISENLECVILKSFIHNTSLLQPQNYNNALEIMVMKVVAEVRKGTLKNKHEFTSKYSLKCFQLSIYRTGKLHRNFLQLLVHTPPPSMEKGVKMPTVKILH